MSRRTPPRIIAVRAVALLTALMGVVNLLSAVLPALHARFVVLRAFLPLEVVRGAHLAFGLWRRKKVALIITMGLCVVTAVSHLI